MYHKNQIILELFLNFLTDISYEIDFNSTEMEEMTRHVYKINSKLTRITTKTKL